MANEFRTVRQADFTDVDLKGRNFRGYAAVFDTGWNERLVEDMGYVEKVAYGAFRKALATGADVPLLIGHERNMLLATSKSGNLRLREEPKGLLTEALLPDNYLGEYARSMIDNDDLKGMSYGIALDPKKDVLHTNERGVMTRTIAAVRRLLDVSLTWEPAYTATTVELRSQGFVAIPVQEAPRGEESQPGQRGTESPPDEGEPEAWWDEEGPADSEGEPKPESAREHFRNLYYQELEREV